MAAGTNSNRTNNAQTSLIPPTSTSKQKPFASTPHTFNLDAVAPQFSNAVGMQTIANADNFPILSTWAMSVFLVRLNKGGVLEPHWHPNAAELGYCIGGRAEMTIYPSNVDADSFTVNTFTIDPGEIVFVPQGFMHNIENISNQETKFVIAYNNERPTTIGISGSVGSMPNRVMDRTFGIKPPNTFFNGFNKNSPKDTVIGSSISMSAPNCVEVHSWWDRNGSSPILLSIVKYATTLRTSIDANLNPAWLRIPYPQVVFRIYCTLQAAISCSILLYRSFKFDTIESHKGPSTT